MKNIETILSEVGITLTDEQKATVNKELNENYKTVAEVEKKEEKIKTLTDKLHATEETLKAFDGIDADGMKRQIEELNATLAKKDEEFKQKLLDRDFDDILKESIAEAKGLNAKAIKSLLDVDALKASQNQKEDIATALKALSESEDSKMLFATVEPKPLGDPIGAISKQTRTINNLDEIYANNPFYNKNKK